MRSVLRRPLVELVVLVMVLGVTGLLTIVPSRAAEQIVPVPSAVETAPGSHSGDSIDDPAIWVHPTDPSRSLILANDKLGSLDVYSLDGTLVQRLTGTSSFWGNVDVKQGVRIGGVPRDIVAVNHGGGIKIYEVDPDTRQLSSVTDGKWGGSAEGLCLYHSNVDGTVYAINVTLPGHLRQWELADTDGDGLIEGTLRREFQVGSESEGCVTHDETGELYLSEEDVALWRYEAEPDGGTARSVVDRVLPDGHAAADLEGLAIADAGAQGAFLIASAQNVTDADNNHLTTYAATDDNAFVRSFRVVNGTGSDDCDRTDGIAAYAGDLGPDFPRGVFVCQDHSNVAPGTSGNQDLKLVRLEDAVPLSSSPVNRAPVARMTTSCEELTCTFSAGGSADTDGTVTEHRWDLGDGVTASGSRVTHTYETPGTRSVTLRVVDDGGAGDRQVRLVATAPVIGDALEHVGADHSTALKSTRSFSAQVPPSVVAGDALIAVWSGSGDGDLAAPAGWTRIGSTIGRSNATTVWRRVADGTEAGAPVTVQTPTYMRGVLALSAYRGTDPQDPVSAVSGLGHSTSTSNLTTPVVSATEPGGWRVSAWSAKTSADLTMGTPPGEAERARLIGSGSGAVSLLLSDSGSPVAAGSQGGLTATLSPAVDKATTWTILLRPASATPPPPNQVPTASFSHACQGTTCTVDARASADPDGAITRYDWVFEDLDRGAGATTSHTFSAAGTYPVTLTVTDDAGAQDSITSNVTVDDAPPTTEVEFVGADHSTLTKASRSWTVSVPDDVRTGDGLVLVFAASSTTGLTGPGEGWAELDASTAGSATTTTWHKVADAADAGAGVAVTAPTWMRGVLAVLAYRGTGPDPVGAHASRAVTSSGSSHTTPLLAAAPSGSWRLSLWSAKSSSAAPWTLPPGETARVSFVGSGSGQVSLLATDSAGPVGSGPQGGLTAAGVSSNKVTTWTLLVPSG